MRTNEFARSPTAKRNKTNFTHKDSLPLYAPTLVMAGLGPAIHVFLRRRQDVDARHIGERSDAVLRTAMAGHDVVEWFGIAGLDPAIHGPRRTLGQSAWTAGSSPAVTT
jgi:hypothetical protein